MTSEAWEKAVEAGAEALSASVHPEWHQSIPRYWERRPDEHKAPFRDEAAATLRAAFPILAEELAGEIEQTSVEAERRSTAAHRLGDTATSTHERAIALGRMDAADFIRARIEQMKEQS